MGLDSVRAPLRVFNAAQNKRKSCVKRRNLPILRRMRTRAIAAEKRQVFDPVKRSVHGPCVRICNVLGSGAKPQAITGGRKKWTSVPI
jgi:hypothetical protein